MKNLFLSGGLMETCFEAQFCIDNLNVEGYADNMSLDEIRSVIDDIERQKAFRNKRLLKYSGCKHVPAMSFMEIKQVVDSYRDTLSQDIYKRYGGCYKLSGRFLQDTNIVFYDEVMRLVHGYLYEDDCVSDHAWIEINGFLYDPVYDDFESINAVKKARKRKAVFKYCTKDANLLMVEKKHWGPWEDLPERTLVRYGNQVFDFRTGNVVSL